MVGNLVELWFYIQFSQGGTFGRNKVALSDQPVKTVGAKYRGGKVVPLTRIQKLIGRRMCASKQSKPCFYVEATADVTELMASRPKLRKSLGVKITTNAFYIRAVAMAVVKYPLMTGIGEGEIEPARVRIPDCVNVGFAVSAPHGLVVPVIKSANEKSLAKIASLEKELTDKARDNELTLDEMEGETIALSNLGAYGIDSFIGIIPPPTSSIVAVGNVVNKIIPRDGGPVARKVVSLTVAADHKIINGRYAAEFLSLIREQLEDSEQLL